MNKNKNDKVNSFGEEAGLKGYIYEYEERAQLLNLDSLSCRMDKGDIILVY